MSANMVGMIRRSLSMSASRADNFQRSGIRAPIAFRLAGHRGSIASQACCSHRRWFAQNGGESPWDEVGGRVGSVGSSITPGADARGFPQVHSHGRSAARLQVTRTQISQETFNVSGALREFLQKAPREQAHQAVAKHADATEHWRPAGRQRSGAQTRQPGSALRGNMPAARCVAYCTAETYGECGFG